MTPYSIDMVRVWREQHEQADEEGAGPLMGALYWLAYEYGPL